MEKSQLIVVLRTFSKKEVRDCRKWLQSPVHNQRSDVLELFEYLVSYDHLDNEKFLEKERVFRKIFPTEPYDSARLRQTVHFLLKALEDFLVYQALQEDQVRLKIFLAKAYRERGIGKAFTKTVKETENLQEQSPYRDHSHLHDNYLLQVEKYRFLNTKRRVTDLNLQEVHDALDLAYIADKLRQGCVMLSHQAVYRKTYRMVLMDEILAQVEKNNLQDIPAIGMYYYSFKAATDRSEVQHFEMLKKLIGQHSHLFPHQEIRGIYLMALNYCVAKINEGRENFIRESFDILRQGLENKILLENGIVSRVTFINAVASSIKLKEYSWADNFIHEFKSYLEPQYQDSFFNYSLAMLKMDQKDYATAMRLLVNTDFDDLLIHLNAKTMLFKMYYELNEFDALESLLESMRAYMHRKKVIGYHRDIYSNLIRYTRKLVRINPYDKSEKEKLKKEIQDANPLAERGWLLKQLDAL